MVLVLDSILLAILLAGAGEPVERDIEVFFLFVGARSASERAMELAAAARRRN